MIPIGATDPKSGVYQGRENTGEATVFNSGNFDPVSFHARRAEVARMESERLREEKKKKLANMNLLENYNPASQEGSKEIYKTFGDASKAFAEAAAQGLDFEDPTLPIGQQWIQLQGELKAKIAGDKQVNDWLTQGMEVFTRNVGKYDQEVFQQTYDAAQKAPTIAERVKIMQTMPLLSPDYDPNLLLKQIKIKPNIAVDRIDGGKRVKVVTYSPEAIQTQIALIKENPENKPYLDKYEKDLASGKRTIPFDQLVESELKKQEYISESFAPQPRASSGGIDITFGNGSLATDYWQLTMADQNNPDSEVVLSSSGGKTAGQQNPAITVEGVVKGKPNERVPAQVSGFKPNPNMPSGYEMTVTFEALDTEGRMSKFTKTVDMTEFNKTNLFAEIGASWADYHKMVQGANRGGKKAEAPKTSTNNADQYLNQLLGK
jgi:hypothetical protein